MYFTPENDPPIMALSGAIRPIVMRNLAQRMRRDVKNNGFFIVWIYLQHNIIQSRTKSTVLNTLI